MRMSMNNRNIGIFSVMAISRMELTERSSLLAIPSGDDMFVKVVDSDVRGFKVCVCKRLVYVNFNNFVQDCAGKGVYYDIKEHGVDEDDKKTIWKFIRKTREGKGGR